MRARSRPRSDPRDARRARHRARVYRRRCEWGSEELAAYLDAVAGLLAEDKRSSIEAMGLQPGDAGLDVGCGTGDEVRLIAERVGPSGRAVGVDISEDLLRGAGALVSRGRG